MQTTVGEAVNLSGHRDGDEAERREDDCGDRPPAGDARAGQRDDRERPSDGERGRAQCQPPLRRPVRDSGRVHDVQQVCRALTALLPGRARQRGQRADNADPGRVGRRGREPRAPVDAAPARVDEGRVGGRRGRRGDEQQSDGEDERACARVVPLADRPRDRGHEQEYARNELARARGQHHCADR